MAYSCQYSIDRGVNCKKWVKPSEDGRPVEEYCTEHKDKIYLVEAMWSGVTTAIKAAQQKRLTTGDSTC